MRNEIDDWLVEGRLGVNSPANRFADDDDEDFDEDDDEDEYETCPDCGASFDEECDDDCEYRGTRAQ